MPLVDNIIEQIKNKLLDSVNNDKIVNMCNSNEAQLLHKYNELLNISYLLTSFQIIEISMKGPCYICRDNQSMLNNTTILELTLKKKI